MMFVRLMFGDALGFPNRFTDPLEWFRQVDMRAKRRERLTQLLGSPCASGGAEEPVTGDRQLRRYWPRILWTGRRLGRRQADDRLIPDQGEAQHFFQIGHDRLDR